MRINTFIEHPLKLELEKLQIRQYDISHSLNMSQSHLSRMLCGIVEMPKFIEEKITAILNSLNKSYRPKRPIIIKR